MSKKSQVNPESRIKPPQDETVELLANPCFSEQTVRAINEVSGRFREESNIQAVELARVYDDGSAIILYSDPRISNHVVQNKIHVTAHVPQEMVAPQFCYLPSRGGPYQHLLMDFKQISGSQSFANFIQRFKGYYDMFCFISKSEIDSAPNLFINAKEKSEGFALDFRDRLSQLISKLDRTRLKLPQKMLPNLKGLDAHERPRVDSAFSFQGAHIRQELEVVLAQTSHLNLTSRELDCMVRIAKGKTAKEIGIELGLSHRTVEQYIDSLKGKLNCEKKSQICERWEQIVNGQKMLFDLSDSE